MKKLKKEKKSRKIIAGIMLVLSVFTYFSGLGLLFMSHEELNIRVLKMPFGLMILGTVLSLTGLFLSRKATSIKDLGGIDRKSVV